MLSVRIGLTRLARSVLVGSKRKMAASVTNLSDKRTITGRTIRCATYPCRVFASKWLSTVSKPARDEALTDTI